MNSRSHICFGVTAFNVVACVLLHACPSCLIHHYARRVLSFFWTLLSKKHSILARSVFVLPGYTVSHGAPLMLLNNIPPPGSSLGTLRMLLKKNNPVWRSNHSDLRFVFDSEENPLVPLRLDLDISLGLLQVKCLLRPKHISTWLSRTTTGSAIDCQFHRFHGEICLLI